MRNTYRIAEKLSRDLISQFDKLNAEDVAADLGISRAAVFNQDNSGRLSPRLWSRTWLSRRSPTAPASYLTIIRALIAHAITLHGADLVADRIVHIDVLRDALRGAVALHDDLRNAVQTQDTEK